MTLQKGNNRDSIDRRIAAAGAAERKGEAVGRRPQRQGVCACVARESRETSFEISELLRQVGGAPLQLAPQDRQRCVYVL